MGKIVHTIEKAAEAKHISKTALAKKLGVSRDQLYDWTDDNIKFMVVHKACEVLGLDIAAILPQSTIQVNEPGAEYGKKENCQEEIKFLKGIIKHHQDTIAALNSAVTVLTNQLNPSEGNKAVILKKNK